MEVETAQAIYEGIARDLADMGAVSSQMFGMPCLKIEGKAFAGLLPDYMVFKLAGEAHAHALGLSGAQLFDPAGGRPMKQWVQVPSSSQTEWPALAESAFRTVDPRQ